MDSCNLLKMAKKNWYILLLTLIVGLFCALLFSNKSNKDIETIAVSPDEKYIAYFETGDGHKIRCFQNDGTLAFDYYIPSEMSAGGYCTLWFDGNVLFVLFYRTDKVARFTMNGTTISIDDYTDQNYPPKFMFFSYSRNKYSYIGTRIDVVYDRQSFLGYWLLNRERCAMVVFKDGTRLVLDRWSSTE